MNHRIYGIMTAFEKESFLNWLIGMPDRENDKWEQWSNSSEENKTFTKKARLYLSALQNNQNKLETEEVTALWQKIETSIYNKPKAKNSGTERRLIISPLLRIAAAASIILLIGLGSIYKLNQVKIEAPLGEKVTCVLPDGSSVDLNAAGKITYNKLTWKLKRNLRLKGEAFFKVAKGEEFTIFCPTASVSVLGTSFNIYARRDYFRTECYTGRVKVKIPKEKFEKILIHNEAIKAGLNQKASWSRFENAQTAPTWITGEFYYDKTPFTLVLREIENQFKVKFERKEIDESILFTGYFNTKNLDKALEFVLVPMGYQYEINKNQIKLIKISTEN